ncbi:MAG: copper chaperone PCu(A)C [Proteobacteria bacterium]|nr:copper chaperone PCu(A)C [Pseudomonadota bacterium]
MRMFAAVLAATTLLAAPALAHEAKVGGLTLQDLRVKASLKGVNTTAAYLTVVNPGPKADRLVSATCECGAKVTLHRMWMDHGVMRMRAADKGLEVPAHGELKLAPGGDHLMLTGLKAPLEDKGKVTLTLTFAHAGKVTTFFHVTADPGASMGPMAGMKH